MGPSENSFYRISHAHYQIALVSLESTQALKLQDYSYWLQRALDLPPTQTALQRLSDGSICFLNSSQKLSISHKNSLLCLAVTDQAQISHFGCDLEELNEEARRDWRPFVGRFFTTADVTSLCLYKNKQQISQDQSYLTFFSLKEAVLKASKLTIDPLQFAIGYHDKTEEFFLCHEGGGDSALGKLTLKSVLWDRCLITLAYKIEPTGL